MVRKFSLSFFFIVSILLGGCAPQIAQEPFLPETQLVETSTPENMPPTEAPPTEIPVPNNEWVTYRDPRYGIGLAYPCWWAFTPMPSEGFGGAISLRSFDEEYFRAHSTKGNWNGDMPPEGVFALDVAVFENINPALSTVDAWKTFTDPSMSEIASVEERMIGQNSATVVRMLNLNNSSDPPATLYLFRLSPDKLLMINPLFQDRIDSDDIQGILISLSLDPNQAIIVPAFAPHEPLIAAAYAGK
ncbi:MAG: hypothetical protein PVJ21_01085 [Anaerolineales bacterium]|jgi:hypothetical protein